MSPRWAGWSKGRCGWRVMRGQEGDRAITVCTSVNVCARVCEHARVLESQKKRENKRERKREREV